MNTKQKLTLGIAAIFMVTLTIVGVTYAYFVTRVTGATTESVNVQTASLASVEYGDGNAVVTLADALPGTSVYKYFTVENKGAAGSADASYDIFLTSATVTGKPEFVHAKTDTACYNSEAVPSDGGAAIDPDNVGTATATCFDGGVYNNVQVTLYKTKTGTTLHTTDMDATAQQTYLAGIAGDSNKVELVGTESQGLIYTSEDNQYQDLASGLVVPAATKYYYILKVDYINNDSNQNIENLAAVDVKVDIR